MKILFLNPVVDANHGVSAKLKSRGAAVLFAADTDEAWKVLELHGASLDLAIIHREPRGSIEAVGDLNLQMIQKIKADPRHADLPIIVTSSVWKDAEFARHQQGARGANAYLQWPVAANDLVRTIEAMFGGSVEWASSSSGEAAPPTPEPTTCITGVGTEAAGGVSLEAVSPEALPDPNGTSGISLIFEAPPEDGSSGSQSLGITSSPEKDPLLSPGSMAIAEPTALSIAVPPAEEELEPHERLMLANSAKKPLESAPASTPQSLSSPVPEGGTEVLSVSSDPNATAIFSAEGLAAAADPADALEIPDLTGASLQALTERNISAPPETSSEPVRLSAESEEALASNLPYLFGRKGAQPGQAINPVMIFAEPVGDAVVPGGAVQAPDVETLRKYLLLREQDVAVLSNQLRAAREQVFGLDRKLKDANGQILELRHVVGEHERKLEERERERAHELETLRKENEDLRFQGKAKADKARLMEAQVKEAQDEIERLKERVRTDIRKIRVREKELENKLEIMRRDSEALIAAREGKVIELKRKVDLLEFNIDLLQDQYSREKETSAQLRERLGRAAQVVRVAGGLLDSSPANGLDNHGEGADGGTSGAANEGDKQGGDGVRGLETA